MTDTEHVAACLSDAGYPFAKAKDIIDGRARTVIGYPTESDAPPDGITLVMPTIPPRRHERQSAFRSVGAQEVRPDAIVVPIDYDGDGDVATRRRGVGWVATRWLAFLDDDDEWLPNHLADLSKVAEDYGASFVSSDFVGWTRPENLNNLYLTNVLIETDLVRQAASEGDWGCFTGAWDHVRAIMQRQRRKAAHCAWATWRYNNTQSATVGLPWTAKPVIDEVRALLPSEQGARLWRRAQNLPDRPILGMSDAYWRDRQEAFRAVSGGSPKAAPIVVTR